MSIVVSFPSTLPHPTTTTTTTTFFFFFFVLFCSFFSPSSITAPLQTLMWFLCLPKWSLCVVLFSGDSRLSSWENFRQFVGERKEEIKTHRELSLPVPFCPRASSARSLHDGCRARCAPSPTCQHLQRVFFSDFENVQKGCLLSCRLVATAAVCLLFVEPISASTEIFFHVVPTADCEPAPMLRDLWGAVWTFDFKEHEGERKQS